MAEAIRAVAAMVVPEAVIKVAEATKVNAKAVSAVVRATDVTVKNPGDAILQTVMHGRKDINLHT